MFKSKQEVDDVLNALGDQLTEIGKDAVDLLVCGGSALQALGLISRATKDVDVVALISHSLNQTLLMNTAKPLPDFLIEAAKKVGRDFNLLDDWLNPGPTSALDFGLPEGVLDRAEVRNYGKHLTARFLSRYDQIHFKLYAAVDQGGKHYQDLVELKPTSDELEKASRWSMIHDSSEGYKGNLKRILIAMGYENVAQRI